MSDPALDGADLPVSTTMAHLRSRKRDATQALLGDTISISDDAWQEPSLLPGWTRAHVATHLARNADGLRRVANGLLTHAPAHMYPDERTRQCELEQGSRRGALDLQIDLDTSAGQLNGTFNHLEESGSTELVELSPGRRMPANHLPVARLREVVLHHIDLDCGFTAADVEGDIARWLLEWTCLELEGQEGYPLMVIASHSGLVRTIGVGSVVEPHWVRGTDAVLLGWLTGRGDADAVEGAQDVTLPGAVRRLPDPEHTDEP